MTLDEKIREQAKKVFLKTSEAVGKKYEQAGEEKVQTDLADSFVNLYAAYEQASVLDKETKDFMEPHIGEIVSEMYEMAKRKDYKPPKVKGNSYEKAEALIEWVVEEKVF